MEAVKRSSLRPVAHYRGARPPACVSDRYQPYLACVCCLLLWPCDLRCSSSIRLAAQSAASELIWCLRLCTWLRVRVRVRVRFRVRVRGWRTLPAGVTPPWLLSVLKRLGQG